MLSVIRTAGRLTWSQPNTRRMRLNLRFGVTVDGDQPTGISSKAGRPPAGTVIGRVA